MTTATLTPRDIVLRSYERALPAKKFVRLLRSRLSETSEVGEDELNDLAACLLEELFLDPSSLLLSYLSNCLSTPSVLSPQTVIIHILSHISQAQDNLSTSGIAALASIASILTNSPTLSDPFPALITLPAHPVPSIGTSASALPSPGSSEGPIPTLKLLLPLLRLCTSPETPFPIITLTGRILGSLLPTPAPPLEIGVEAGGLLPILPEGVVGPLRNCLTGLMADTALASALPLQSQISVPTGILGGTQNGNLGEDGGKSSGETAGIPDLPPLSKIWNNPRPTPPWTPQQSAQYLLTYAHSASKFASSTLSPSPSNTPSTRGLPPPHLQEMLTLGKYLIPNPDQLWLHLIESSILSIIDTYKSLSSESVYHYLFLMEQLPGLLSFSKDNGDPEVKIADILGTAFTVLGPGMKDWKNWNDEEYGKKCVEAEADQEADFMPVDGWTIRPLDEAFVTKLANWELIASGDVSAMLGGRDVSPLTVGESLVTRLCTCSERHIPVVEHLVAVAAGAQKAFAEELIQHIEACPQTPPPEQLFVRLAGRESLIASLESVITPTALLALAVDHLLVDSVDGINEDPQGNLTRFGEGFLLVESIAKTFHLPLPPLLQVSRRAVGMAVMTDEQKGLINGWIKALFGADGIDDEILLSTTPSDFCWLAPSLIQQAVHAFASGTIDQDTLHSGLSYFIGPLLSWSLPAIIIWLCNEIRRNGPIAGIHADVLVGLINLGGFPDSVLLIAGEEIAKLLDPSLGLMMVFEAANIDVPSVRERLQELSIPMTKSDDGNMNNMSQQPSQILQNQLQLLRRLDLAPLNWSNDLIASIQTSIISLGSTRTTEIIVSEILYPNIADLERANDPLAWFVPTLLASRGLDGSPFPLLQGLISGFLPTFLSTFSGDTTALTSLANILKTSLLLLSEARLEMNEPSVADVFISGLERELNIARAGEGLGSWGQGGHIRKKTKTGQATGHLEETMSQKAAKVLGKSLGGDDELKTRWPSLGKLST